MRTTHALDGRSRVVPLPADILELVRPRLVALSLSVVVLSYAASGAPPEPRSLALALLGAVLALGGASVFNQVLERRADGLMRRTAHRPLPAGRIAKRPAAAFGALLSASGVAVLAAGVNLAAAGVAAGGWILYVCFYTPLKARSAAAVAVGAAAGAVPVLLGWAVGRGELGAGAWALYAVVALWQLPHSLAIGWMYRSDYRRAGLHMVPFGQGADDALARAVAASGVALVPVSLLPWAVGPADGGAYALAALVIGLAFMATAIDLFRRRTGAAARLAVKASVVYLPVLLLLLVADVRLA